ncbi:exopolysaccharide biosynthesis polyprenyl glycosylphosphotransferase [Acidisoma sp.]|uniref:exopolysaccharide biosynthesis polyprenyl glycosylphosphotransferase n=1 Tax=Acidisoma sp. TaxID=1872115 RepID=UPI003AFFD226
MSAVVWLAEAATVLLTTLGVAFALRKIVPADGHDVAIAGFVIVLTFCLLHRVNRRVQPGSLSSYPQQFKRTLHLMPILLCSAMAGTFVLALGGDTRPELATTMAIWLATTAVALLAVSSVGNYALTHPSVAHRMARKVAVIGHDCNASRVADVFMSRTSEPVRLLGIYSDEPSRQGDMTVTGSVDELIELSRGTAIDDIVIAVPPDADALEMVAQLRWRLRGVAVEVYIMPYLAQGEDAGLPVEMFGSLPLMAVQRRPLTQAQAVSKRVVDIALGLLLLFLLLPVLIVIAAAVKLDSPGPVLFRQPRLGFNDRPFTVLKFRSMFSNAADLMAARQTSRHDPRVTRVGKWLRKLSLDELPQLFNVLAGDMSLVGPRPHAPHTRAGGQLLKDAMAEYVIRHQVRPGITGWAQVNGARGELVTMDDLRRRVTYDLEYIQKWSVWFDLRIISMTVLREVFSKHAF